MTEPTIAEVLAKYPDCEEFICASGITWARSELYVHDKFYRHVSISGLRPKTKKRKVTVEGWIYGLGMSGVTRFRSENLDNLDNILPGKSYKAALTYETDAESEPGEPQGFILSSDANGHLSILKWYLKPNTKYRVTFTEVDE